MNRQLTQALERLNNDRRYRQAFRRDPASATRRFQLNADEIDALRGGDEARLAALGADVASVQKQPTHPRRLAAFAHAFAPAAAVLLLTLGISSDGLTQRSMAGRRLGVRAMRRIGLRRTTSHGIRAKRWISSGIRAKRWVNGARVARRSSGTSQSTALASVPVDLLA